MADEKAPRSTKRQTTAPVTLRSNSGEVLAVLPSQVVYLRFQVAPGSDDDLAILAPYPLPWRISRVERDVETSVTVASVEGTIPKNDRIEIPVPIALVDRVLTRAMLEITWDKDAKPEPIRMSYDLEWQVFADKYQLGLRLLSLGYRTGYLDQPFKGSAFTFALAKGFRPPSSGDQQALLQFQADLKLTQDARFSDEVEIDLVRKSKGAP